MNIRLFHGTVVNDPTSAQQVSQTKNFFAVFHIHEVQYVQCNGSNIDPSYFGEAEKTRSGYYEQCMMRLRVQ
jgi:hypothetical protein